MHAWDYVPYERADGRAWDDDEGTHYVEAHARATWAEFIETSAPTTCSRTTATAPSTWSARRRASAAAICTASPATTYQYGAAPADAGLGPKHGAGLRAALSRRAVPAPGRRRVRRGPRGGHAGVRGARHRFRQDRGARPMTHAVFARRHGAHRGPVARAQRQRAADQGQGLRHDAAHGPALGRRAAQGRSSCLTPRLLWFLLTLPFRRG